jgi:hypothetical protein
MPSLLYFMRSPKDVVASFESDPVLILMLGIDKAHLSHKYYPKTSDTIVLRPPLLDMSKTIVKPLPGHREKHSTASSLPPTDRQ